MSTFDLGFDVEELNSENWVAYINIWAAPRGADFAVHPRASAGAYAALVAGEGAPRRNDIWGAGFSTSDDFLRASGVLHLLGKLPDGRRLEVRCKGLKQIVEDARNAVDGLKSDGKTPFEDHDVYMKIADAEDKKRLVLVAIKGRQAPHGLRLAKFDVEDKPTARAKALVPLHSQIEPNVILATSDEPNLMIAAE